jgi:hypothetical protein
MRLRSFVAPTALLLAACIPLRGQSPVTVSGPSPFAGVTADKPASQFGTLYMDAEVEPHIVANPANPQHLVGAWQQDRWSSGGARGHVAAVSRDGGATWQRVVVPGISLASGGALQRTSSAWLSFAPNGNLYHACIAFDSDASGLNRVLVSRSTDGGLTWGAPVIVKQDDQNATDAPLNDKETITADTTDTRYAYVIWARFDATGSSAWFARTTNGGATWEAARKIYSPGDDRYTQGHRIVVRPDGTLAAFFTVESALASGKSLVMITSPDKGATWANTSPRQVAILTPCTIRDPDTNAAMRTGAGLFDVACDPANGNLYCVWQDGRFGNQAYGSIAFSQSTDGGATWSTPVAINQTPAGIGNANRQAFTPAVAVASDGTIGVLYYDFRNNTVAPGALADAFLLRCKPTPSAPATAPANWRETRLTAASFDVKIAPDARGLFLGDYIGLAAAGDGFAALFTATHGTDRASVFCARAGSPRGDADGDGLVTAADAAAALRMAAGLRVPSAAEAGRADVTADARVTAADATVIARLAAGL